MPELPDRQSLVPQVRAMQAIVGALVSGIVMFALLVLVLEMREPTGGMILSLIALALGLICLMLGVVIPQTIGVGGSVSGVGIYQTRLIISCGLLEGAAFLNLVAYWLELQLFSIGFAALMLLFILWQFPTVDRVLEWLNRQEELAGENRGQNDF